MDVKWIGCGMQVNDKVSKDCKSMALSQADTLLWTLFSNYI